MAKTLVHKTNKVESLTITGTLDSGLFITGENGDRVDVTEHLMDFEGQEITVTIKTKEEDTIEVIE